MKMLLTMTLATAVMAGLGATAQAEDGNGKGYKRHGAEHAQMRHHRKGRHGGGMMLRMLDTDMDQMVSMEEFMHLNDRRFGNADANSDGTLDAGEVDAMIAKRAEAMRARMMERLDADGDGTLSAAEFAAPRQKRFSRLDRNDDGELNRSDMRGGKKRRHRNR